MFQKKIYKNSLLLVLFFCFIQNIIAQYDFSTVKKWQEENNATLGGRSVLLIYKDEKIVFENIINEQSKKQKIITKIIAKKQGQQPKEIVKDFTEESSMPIASCSKWLSAALVLTFVDEGKLSLTDTVGEFLPILRKSGKGNITIAQCLSHTTGINAGNLKESIKQFKAANTMDDAMEIINLLPIDSKPGESFRYSNVGLQIAGAVVEKVSGRDFKTLFDERIAKPCGMMNTNFGKKKLPIPAGSAESTPKDYMKFLTMLLHEGIVDGKRILKRETVIAMQSDNSYGKKVMGTPTEAGTWTYGLGEWIMESVKQNERCNVVSSPGLFGTFPWIDNKMGYAAILFTYNVKSKGRHEKYISLKRTVDECFIKK
jgi:CubicO group peptidase (beta-lactamase class C family)